ncbi:MAG: hypothetical protein UY91_C0010G0004 [Parcubacteria group bacterium GW2011_GWB1_55_9]|nr:MAG: hypothetical protein UY91_C0010G0004 [Parcubacteria group bacterium GW2011_GWB1_55_9]
MGMTNSTEKLNTYYEYLHEHNPDRKLPDFVRIIGACRGARGHTLPMLIWDLFAEGESFELAAAAVLKKKEVLCEQEWRKARRRRKRETKQGRRK